MKKLFAALLCAVMVLSSVVQVAALHKFDCYFKTVADDNFTVGDVNDDKRVNSYDTLELKKYCASMAEINKDGADINCDAVVNAKDLLILTKPYIS